MKKNIINNFIEEKDRLLNDLSEVLDNPSSECSDETKELLSTLADEDYFLGALEKTNIAYENRNQKRLNKKLLESKKNRRLKIYKRIALIGATAAVIAISFNIYNKSESNEVIPELITEYITPTLITSNSEIVLKGKPELSYKQQKNIKMDSITPITKANETHKVVIPKGYTYDIVLSDGTEVTLNSGSELSYPTTFNTNERLVEIKGEGYFKVKKGDTPFIVNNNGIKIKVYGTEFNVREGRDNIYETILIEGSVGVTVPNGKEVMIKPNALLR